MRNTVHITGSSSMIGLATAKLFQEKGWNVAATIRSSQNQTVLIETEDRRLARIQVTNIGHSPSDRGKNTAFPQGYLHKDERPIHRINFSDGKTK